MRRPELFILGICPPIHLSLRLLLDLRCMYAYPKLGTFGISKVKKIPITVTGHGHGRILRRMLIARNPTNVLLLISSLLIILLHPVSTDRTLSPEKRKMAQMNGDLVDTNDFNNFTFHTNNNIVKPLYNDNPWDPKIVAKIDRWSLFRGHLRNKSYNCDLKMVFVVDKWSLFGVGH